LRAQLGRRRAALDRGAERVGWKLGMGDRERIGGEIVIGHLTSATRLEPGSAYRMGDTDSLHADAELALELGAAVPGDASPDAALDAVAGFGAALELVDLARPPDDAETIVAENVFHRAVAFGPLAADLPERGEARLVVNGQVVAVAPIDVPVADRVLAIARLLEALGERLEPGDRIITGSIVQVPVGAGQDVVADLGGLGGARLKVVR
jgi:2-keto-4-pentenoate hydratase